MSRLQRVSGRLGAGLLLVVGLRATWAQAPETAAVDAIFADVTAPGSPGCALGVYQGGKVIYAKGYGLANVEQNLPISPQSVFDVGSISKQFTAASILLLEQQGKLRLDDDIRKYIPELPNYSGQAGEKITLLNILNHTSGLRDYVALLQLSGVHFDNVTTDEDGLGILVRQKGLNFIPGSDWQYTNSGYFLLSLVVKRVTGKTLKDFAAENIFGPLGMVHTQYRNDHAALIANRVLAYEPTERGDFRLSVSYAEENGDGMVHTSVEDLQKWDENWYSGHVGGGDLLHSLEAPGTLASGAPVGYAKGVRVSEYRGLRTVWHSGGTGGYNTVFLRFPEQHFAIACLCNNGKGVTRRSYAVADAYLAGVMKSRELPERAPPESLRVWAGTYRDARTADIWRIADAGGKLQAEYEDGVVDFRPLTATTFDSPSWYVHLTFAPAGGSVVRTLTVTSATLLPHTLEAVQQAKPTAAELAAYVGDYRSTELRAAYRLALKDGKLSLAELIGSDGSVHTGTIPSNDLRPVLRDEFDLRGAPLVFRFTRDARQRITGFKLSGFHERWIVFERA